MFSNIIVQWDVIQKLFLNTILVSIPEEFFMVIFTLILVGEFDFWKEEECKKLLNRWDYGRLFIPTIAGALVSNILRFILKVEDSTIPTLLTIFILMILTNHIFSDASAFKWIGKVFLFLLLSAIIVGVSELIYVPFIISGTGKDIVDINQNILSNVLISLPSRVFQYMLLFYFVSRKRTLLKGNVYKNIMSSPILLLFISIISLFDLTFFIVANKLIVQQKIIDNLSLFNQVIVVIGVILFPIINLSGLLLSIYYLKNQELKTLNNSHTQLNELLKKIRNQKESEGNASLWKLNEIGMGIEEVAASMEKLTRSDKTKK